MGSILQGLSGAADYEFVIFVAAGASGN